MEDVALAVFYTFHKYEIIRSHGKAKETSVVYSRRLYQAPLFYISD